MAIPLFEYISMKDKYCISYFGDDPTLIQDLIKARDIIENKFKGLHIFIACSDSMRKMVQGLRNIILESQAVKFRGKMAYNRTLEKKDDLIRILNESNITIGA